MEGYDVKLVRNERFKNNPSEGATRPLPLMSATASQASDGKIHVSLSNVNADEEQEVVVNLNGFKARKVTAQILTSGAINDYNSFDNPDKIAIKEFKGAKIAKDGSITLTMPALSIIALEVE